MFIEGNIPDNFFEAAALSSIRGTGAQTFFIGRVRPDRVGDSEVKSIDFTAQRELAEKTVLEIIEESKDKFHVLGAEVWHSLGTVAANKACFLVIINGTHRKESFQALEYVVNEVKKRCPIFGKEVMQDGKSQWKENKK